MSRQSQTEIAVLGALSIAPMTGYAIRAAITETLGFFWRESFGQIYPTLARLEDDGLVRPDAAGRTSGSTYRLTAAGRRRLRTLLAEPIPTQPPRNGTLLRLFFGDVLGDDACRRILTDALDEAHQQLARLTAIRAEVEADGADDPTARYRLVTVLAGQHAARSTAAWARESLDLLGD